MSRSALVARTLRAIVLVTLTFLLSAEGRGHESSHRFYSRITILAGYQERSLSTSLSVTRLVSTSASAECSKLELNALRHDSVLG